MMFTDMLHRYALVSHLLLACSIGHISTTVTGFYDIITHFLSNKTCVAILYNYCLMLFIFCCKIPIMIFIGQLTRLETEELIESLRSYLTDSILFLVLSKPKHLGKELLVSDLIRSLAILLAIKAFHILLSNRLSHMFEMDIPSFGRVLRVISFIYVLGLVNVFLINFFLHNLTKKNTFTIWVIFELLGMMQSLIFSTIKFIVNLIDLYLHNGLVNKVTLLFYVELLQDMTALITFTTFMVLFFVNNPINIPIYMIIDIIHVAKNLTGRIKMLIEYRKLSKVLNSRFPVYLATNPGENCIICRDSLDDTSRKIDCGHAFHLNCLKSWLFQHSSCPSCRTPIYSSSPSDSPLIDVNSILYNIEQKVLIALKKLFKWSDAFIDVAIGILITVWPFSKILKRRNPLRAKICKVVLILSNKVEKQDSYDCYFLDQNQNMTQLFEFLSNDRGHNVDGGMDNPSDHETSRSGRNGEGSGRNVPRETIRDTIQGRVLSDGVSPNSIYNSYINSNTIGSITAAIELNINVVNVIKRYRFNQLFFLTPNSTSRTSRTSRTGRSTSRSARSRNSFHTKEKVIFDGLLNLLNENDSTYEGSLREVERNIVSLLPLFLASMGSLLGKFTQTALLSVLKTRDANDFGTTCTNGIISSSIFSTGSSPTNATTDAGNRTSDSATVSRNVNVATSGSMPFKNMDNNVNKHSNTTATPTTNDTSSPSTINIVTVSSGRNDNDAATPTSNTTATNANNNVTSSPSSANASNTTGTSGRRHITFVTHASRNTSTAGPRVTTINSAGAGNHASDDLECIGLDDDSIKKEHVKFLVAAKDYSHLMLKLNKKRTLNVTDLLVNLEMIQMVTNNHL